MIPVENISLIIESKIMLMDLDMKEKVCTYSLKFNLLLFFQ